MLTRARFCRARVVAEKGFLTVSWQAVEWVLQECDVDEYVEFRLLSLLAKRANADGTGAWPSVSTLAEEIRRGPRTVQRGLERLRSAGRIRLGDQSLIPDYVASNRRPTVWDVVIPGVTPVVIPDGSGVTTDDTPNGDGGASPDVTSEVGSGATHDDTPEPTGVTPDVTADVEFGVSPVVAVGVSSGDVQNVLPSLRKENVLSSCSTAPQLNLIEPPAPESKSKLASKPGDPDGFVEFWEIYPRRVARGTAVKAYAKALKKADAAVIREGARRYAESRRGKEPEFTAHAASWLNAERWADEPEPAPAVAMSKAMRAVQQGEELRARLAAGQLQQFSNPSSPMRAISGGFA